MSETHLLFTLLNPYYQIKVKSKVVVKQKWKTIALWSVIALSGLGTIFIMGIPTAYAQTDAELYEQPYAEVAEFSPTPLPKIFALVPLLFIISSFFAIMKMRFDFSWKREQIDLNVFQEIINKNFALSKDTRSLMQLILQNYGSQIALKWIDIKNLQNLENYFNHYYQTKLWQEHQEKQEVLKNDLLKQLS